MTNNIHGITATEWATIVEQATKRDAITKKWQYIAIKDGKVQLIDRNATNYQQYPLIPGKKIIEINQQFIEQAICENKPEQLQVARDLILKLRVLAQPPSSVDKAITIFALTLKQIASCLWLTSEKPQYYQNLKTEIRNDFNERVKASRFSEQYPGYKCIAKIREFISEEKVNPDHIKSSLQRAMMDSTGEENGELIQGMTREVLPEGMIPAFHRDHKSACGGQVTIKSGGSTYLKEANKDNGSEEVIQLDMDSSSDEVQHGSQDDSVEEEQNNEQLMLFFGKIKEAIGSDNPEWFKILQAVTTQNIHSSAMSMLKNQFGTQSILKPDITISYLPVDYSKPIHVKIVKKGRKIIGLKVATEIRSRVKESINTKDKEISSKRIVQSSTIAEIVSNLKFELSLDKTGEIQISNASLHHRLTSAV